MFDWLSDWYEIIKAAHIIAIIALMAGMLYLPRLFVYHAEAEPGSDKSETFKVMERRLMNGIINPAFVAAAVFGGLLLLVPGVVDWSMGWIWTKLVAVFFMGGIHGALSRWRKEFAEDRNTRAPRFYRFMNEVPTVLMLVIVVMVVLKPF